MPRFSSASTSTKSGSQCSLFDLPLPLPEDSIYSELKLDPSATAEEVGWAVKVLTDERRATKLRLENEIKETTSKVSGLQRAYDELARVQGAGIADERGLQQMADLENKALDIDPTFQEKRRRAKELGEKVDALNAMDLNKVAGLSKYDEAHPPFALMKLAPASRDEFLEHPRMALWILRRDTTRFLEKNGESVAYASDLEREDFTADFCWNPLLDGDE